jgi:hypothetical protein
MSRDTFILMANKQGENAPIARVVAVAANVSGLGVRAALQTARFQHDASWRHDAKPLLSVRAVSIAGNFNQGTKQF